MSTYAKIIADSVSKETGIRLVSFEIYYPRFILAEINTHKMLAKSTASSRAIPIKKRIFQVRNEPFVPLAFTRNQPGMKADENLAGDEAARARVQWLTAAAQAANAAEELEKLGVHKQHANRVLEPFTYAHTILTGTEWSNFFNLRLHPDAQPEFQELARLMKLGYEGSSPAELAPGEWHTPYVDASADLSLLDRLKVSAARCARVSYRTQDGATSTLDADLELAKRLLTSGHLSPFDHQATPLSESARGSFVREQRHLVGWIPHRTYVEDQAGLVCRSFFL